MERLEDGAAVEQKTLSQWFFKITHYRELLSDLENLTLWPEKVKEQKNWIGKSIGAEIDFEIKEINKKIKIFTTRPDTIMEHHLLQYQLTINCNDLINKSELTKIKDQFNE